MKLSSRRWFIYLVTLVAMAAIGGLVFAKSAGNKVGKPEIIWKSSRHSIESIAPLADGRHIALLLALDWKTSRSGHFIWRLLVLDSRSGEEVAKIDGPGQVFASPLFPAPRGDWGVFYIYRQGLKIYRFKDGKIGASNLENAGLGYNQQPWSGDGRYFICLQKKVSGKSPATLSAVSADLKQKRALLHKDLKGIHNLTWLQNREAMRFIAEEQGKMIVKELDIKSKQITPIAEIPNANPESLSQDVTKESAFAMDRNYKFSYKFSPDGGRVAYIRQGRDCSVLSLLDKKEFSFSVGGGLWRKKQNILRLSWDSTGRQLALLTEDKPAKEDAGKESLMNPVSEYNIWVVNLTAKAASRPRRVWSGEMFVPNIAWSPSGDYLYFIAAGSSQPREIESLAVRVKVLQH